jgi:uncharacterized membrane protein YdbT with pleckstrin-like domain
VKGAARISEDIAIAAMEHATTTTRFDPAAITRPDPALLTHYIIVSFLTVVAWPILLPMLYFKYQTLKYKFDDEGVAMSWGLLFRREIYLTYRRIQDIHVTRGIIQRKLGLASVSVQTASGSAGAEMVIEGIRNPEALRDFLYSKMRGARGDEEAETDTGEAPVPPDESLVLLREIRDELAQLRTRLAGLKP